MNYVRDMELDADRVTTSEFQGTPPYTRYACFQSLTGVLLAKVCFLKELSGVYRDKICQCYFLCELQLNTIIAICQAKKVSCHRDRGHCVDEP